MIKQITPRLSERYKVRIGQKGNQKTRSGHLLPEKLDHFIITSGEKDAAGRLVQDDEMMKLIGKNCKELDIVLMFDDIELNFQTSYAYYTGTTCACRGDGEKAMRRIKDRQPCDPYEVPCPCELQEPDKNGNRRCKPTGRLVFILAKAPRVGGSAVFRTTSWNSIRNIQSSLALIASMTGGVLSGIPLKLTLRPQTVTTPLGKQMKAYVVNVEYDGPPQQLLEVGVKYAQARLAGKERMAIIEARERKLLATYQESPEEVQEIREEFYPETLDNDTPPPAGGDEVSEPDDAPAEASPSGTSQHDGIPPMAEWPQTEDGRPINPETGEIIDPPQSEDKPVSGRGSARKPKPAANVGALF